MEAEPPGMRYQADPGNEYNHLGLLYIDQTNVVTAQTVRRLLIAETWAEDSNFVRIQVVGIDKCDTGK